MLGLFLVSVVGMSAGLWIDTRDMPAAVLISRCTQSSDWVEAIRLHWVLMPATTALMLLAPWFIPYRRSSASLERETPIRGFAAAWRGRVEPLFCGLLMFAGMVQGARLAEQAVIHLNLGPFAGLILAMAAGMACVLILLDGARSVAHRITRSTREAPPSPPLD